MSFGSPGGRAVNIKPTPPERGSFPLDHDGDCKYLIQDYLRCLKTAGGVNDKNCRVLAKGYLKCRMENNLMAPDEMKNLGLEFDEDKAATAGIATPTAVDIGNTKKDGSAAKR